MPSYAPNYTPRLRIKYRTMGTNHTQTWRFPLRGALDVALLLTIAAVQSFYDALQPELANDSSVLTTSVADQDSDIFLPYAAGPTMTGDQDITGGPASNRAVALSFVGRSTGGQPAKIFMYGYATSNVGTGVAGDFRINNGENANIDAAINVLQSTLVGPLLCGNDGLGVAWAEYANAKYMDYWVKRVRTSG